MTSRTRLWVLAISTPVIAFALVGGLLGRLMAANDSTYQHLRVFHDVVGLVVDNYVEEVDIRTAMRGALRGLTDGLDFESTYLTPELVKTFESGAPAGPADPGLDLVRGYYLRVVSVRPNSPADRAGIRTGDFIRAIGGRVTRDISPYEGMRLLQGAQGSSVDLLVIRGNAADPHEVTLTRERPAPTPIASRMADPTTGYIRIVEFTDETGSRLSETVRALAMTGASSFVVDLRGASRGDLDHGVAAARPFIRSGTLVVKQHKNGKDSVSAAAGDGTITARVVLLVDQGTAGAAEVFAAALDAHSRAELVGERTLGRAARQRLTKLPDGSGLLLTTERYLGPGDTAIHERGLIPDVEVPQPEVEFGAAPPPVDRMLDRALEQLTQQKAA
jgi:carboxyl-terminal processing protease